MVQDIEFSFPLYPSHIGQSVFTRLTHFLVPGLMIISLVVPNDYKDVVAYVSGK